MKNILQVRTTKCTLELSKCTWTAWKLTWCRSQKYIKKMSTLFQGLKSAFDNSSLFQVPRPATNSYMCILREISKTQERQTLALIQQLTNFYNSGLTSWYLKTFKNFSTVHEPTAIWFSILDLQYEFALTAESLLDRTLIDWFTENIHVHNSDSARVNCPDMLRFAMQ